MSLSSDARKLAQIVLGLAVAGASGWFTYRILNITPLDRYLAYAGIGGVGVGCILISPTAFYGALKKLASLLPSIKIGGDKP